MAHIISKESRAANIFSWRSFTRSNALSAICMRRKENTCSTFLSKDKKKAYGTVEYRYLSSEIIKNPDDYLKMIQYLLMLPRIAKLRSV